MSKKPTTPKPVETLRHTADKRKNIPTAEYQGLVESTTNDPVLVRYPRNPDLDPQLVWRGKDEQDWSDLVVPAPPLYIQEKIHPKALIDDLQQQSQQAAPPPQLGLFADFNGIPAGADKTEFYQHDQHWSNRFILGDSLRVMASLAEREGLRGKVQCIYFDPPYGIKFNSNFQWSTASRDVKDGNRDHITREPEQVKAFRDTWRDGIHSYLTYLRDRLTVARDLLTESGSIFVQIGDENVHRVRAVMDEVFGEENFVSQISFRTTAGFSQTDGLSRSGDYILWYAKSIVLLKARRMLRFFEERTGYGMLKLADGSFRGLSKAEKEGAVSLPENARIFNPSDIGAQGAAKEPQPVQYNGTTFLPSPNSHWKANYPKGMQNLAKAGRIYSTTNRLSFIRFADDYGWAPFTNNWDDTVIGGFTDEKIYIVQTITKVIQRCLLMATDPGDLVLDPTCGSGTTAFVAEQWGRRWITIDTSRVALALARARLMGARYPFYLLADSREGQQKEAAVTHSLPSTQAVYGNLRLGFVYERVPHITLKSIANNVEIDVIWEQWQAKLEPLRAQLNAALKKAWQEWEVPREAEAQWPDAAKKLHADWWQARIARQQEIDKSIAAKAEFEYLYDKPYEDKKKVRVAGPFTVESLLPHRTLAIDEDDQVVQENGAPYGESQSFAQMILENLRTAGVQQSQKSDKINFTTLKPWPGEQICGEGYYHDVSDALRRAAVFIGPEFGTVTRPDLVKAAREASESGFDVLITCAFNYDAHSTDFNKLGRIAVLKARINADLHMATDLKNTGKGNLFVIFGEPDIELSYPTPQTVQVKILGVDVFHPATGEVRSDGPDGIACWFIDTDYNEESFFVRQAYFLGANDPYDALKTTLKAEINAEVWETLHSDQSRPFPKPKSGRIAVKVINHLGDEVLKVFRVS